MDCFLRKTDADKVLNNGVWGRTLLTRDRLEVIHWKAKETGILGQYAAIVGVYKGGSTRCIALAYPGRKVLAFDTFNGIPNADPAIDGHQNGDFADTSLLDVRAYLADCPNVDLVQGVFPESASICGDLRFSFRLF